uniref:Ca2+ cation antiporter 10 n=1 Tax=Sesuvium portulacastrum TaxID=221166 RepID=A0A221LB05_SESPO|nr:Ca2+ cation antiporter 10 [Sesuvium portulacastrum]
MGISKTEINLRRLLAAAPQQQNQAKLVHYVATLRELLEQLSEETTPEGLPRVSKAKVNDYSEKIESIASHLASPVDLFVETSNKESPRAIEEEKVVSPSGLRKRPVPTSSVEDRWRDNTGAESSPLVKLDAGAHSHIEKHRKLQEDLTDEMVGLARQLKESSLLMSQSLQNTEKILDSTEKAVEHSLASTGHATYTGNEGV